jgi:hypothetical protein
VVEEVRPLPCFHPKRQNINLLCSAKSYVSVNLLPLAICLCSTRHRWSMGVRG